MKLEDMIKEKCEENIFVRSWNSYYAQGGNPMVDFTNELTIHHVETIEELKEAFMMYDAHRQVFVYKSLVFVNSTLGGGWEAWTLKRFGDELVAFESISMQLIIERGGTRRGETFEQYIDRLLKATREQCETLNY